MKRKIDIELIIAYINNEISSNEQKEEVQNLIESDERWFSAYIDLKSSNEELLNTEFEVTPDQLFTNSNKSTIVNTNFNFNWLLRPQIALGAACMLIFVVLISIDREVDGFDVMPNSQPDKPKSMTSMSDKNDLKSATRSAKLEIPINDIVKIEVFDKKLSVLNTSTDILSITLENNSNKKEFELGMFDSSKIDLDNGDNRIIVINSNMETVQDTIIVINE